MNLRRLTPAVAAVVALSLTAVGWATSSSSAAISSSSGPGYVETPISFQVRNVNHSDVACPANGATYVERGDLVTPAKSPTGRMASTVTLYLHGLGLGEFFWNYQGVPGYNYVAAEARAGQTSVVLNRLGYGNSSRPPGNQLCVGSQATVAHEEVMDLRDGNYTLGGKKPVDYANVVLAGHSYGAFIAQVEAYSFGGIRGLINMDWADQGTSALEQADAAQWKQACATSATGYAPFALPAKVPATFFYHADPSIVGSTIARHVADPCGDESSEIAGVAADMAHLGSVRVPVLVLFGERDSLFPTPDGQLQAARFTGSTSVSLATIPDASHAVTLEPTRGLVQATVAAWLRNVVETTYGS